MTKDRLFDLIAYATDALKDDYPFEVKGDDLRVVLDALEEEYKRSDKPAGEPGGSPLLVPGMSFDEPGDPPPLKSGDDR